MIRVCRWFWNTLGFDFNISNYYSSNNKLYEKDILMLDEISVRTIFYLMLEKGQTTMRELFSHKKCFQLTILSIMCVYCVDDKFVNGIP